ncbi:hypothetical protein RIF29_33033 [Crotalaria pallida]|uniref:Uncharacterized protein n=1 Tax=Crotalaria pallida TaxID=3830 RepID=A0AAN9E8H2_CROPI
MYQPIPHLMRRLVMSQASEMRSSGCLSTASCYIGIELLPSKIFDNGTIQPIFPILDHSIRPPLKKLFIEQHNYISFKLDYTLEEPYCKWLDEMTMIEVGTLNDVCKKSNFTGFKKQRMLREDLKRRSNSDGSNVKSKKTTKVMAFSAFEKHYRRKRMQKEGDKRRSFLPYKQVLAGFFINTNRFSRNLNAF